MEKISNKETYLESISNRDLKIYLMGELVKDPLTHPIIKPPVEAALCIIIKCKPPTVL